MHPIQYLRDTYGKKKRTQKEKVNARTTELAERWSYTPVKSKSNTYTCVYIIRHKRSGCFYIGVHTDNEPKSILKSYFTSSELIKTIINLEGVEAFVVERLFYFKNRNDANLFENLLIKRNDPKSNPFILNKYHSDPYIKTKKKDPTAAMKTNIWDPQPYKGTSIRINPQCKILDESYIFTSPTSYCDIPQNFRCK